MKRLTTTVMCAVVLSLGGCSMHFQGEASSGKGSAKSSGNERTAQSKPKAPKKNPGQVADGSRDEDDDAKKPTADKPKDDKPKTGSTGSGGTSAGGAVAIKPSLPGVNVGASDLPSGGSGSNGKPSPGAGAATGGASSGTPKPPVNIGAGAVAGAGSTNQPSKPPVNVNPGAVGGVGSATQPPKPPVNVGAGAGAGAGTKPNGQIVKPPLGTDLVVAVGGKKDPKDPGKPTPAQPGQSAASRAAAKLAAEAAAARGAGALPAGRTPTGKEKPADMPINKPEETGAQPSGAYAMLPATGQSGQGNLRVPVPIAGIHCKVSKTELKIGAKLTVKGQGFAPAAKLTVGGIEVLVTKNKPTQIVAQLPKELSNGGDVILTQGDVVARCGNLTLKR